MKGLFPFLLLALLAACGQEEIQVYRLAKPAAEEAPSAARPAAAAEPGASAEKSLSVSIRELQWRAPSAWRQRPASGMRRATFLVGPKEREAELSVISLPGTAGGDLANVNRWRGQIGLPDIDQAALDREAQKVASAAGPVLVVDYVGAQTRLLAGILHHRGQAWFFKLTGPVETVGEAKPAFWEFLESLRPA